MICFGEKTEGLETART